MVRSGHDSLPASTASERMRSANNPARARLLLVGGVATTLLAEATMSKRATWKPHEKHGELTKQSDLPDSVYAFPGKRKEPMTDASHVRNAIARFDQVHDVNEEEREHAFANIQKAAEHYGVEMTAASWRELGKLHAKK